MECYWDLYVFGLFFCGMDDMIDGGSVALWHVFLSVFSFPTVMDIRIWGGVIWGDVSVCPVLMYLFLSILMMKKAGWPAGLCP